MTALHYAALQGHTNVVKVLLEHPDIDAVSLILPSSSSSGKKLQDLILKICKNHEGKTSLNMCEHNPKSDWFACSELLRNHLSSPVS